jgi:hypothetical protein
VVNPLVAPAVECDRDCNRLVRIDTYQGLHQSNKKRGGVVTAKNHSYCEQQRFSAQDVVWALGIWSVILCLSPVIAFYVLMVA